MDENFVSSCKSCGNQYQEEIFKLKVSIQGVCEHYLNSGPLFAELSFQREYSYILNFISNIDVSLENLKCVFFFFFKSSKMMMK